MAAKKNQDIINSETPILLDFHATWCGPCKAMAPILQDLKNEMGQQGKIIKIDIDKNQKLATTMKVRGVPTFMVYQKGKLLWRASGMVSKNDLRGALKVA
jgi:thioredoxin 1